MTSKLSLRWPPDLHGALHALVCSHGPERTPNSPHHMGCSQRRALSAGQSRQVPAGSLIESVDPTQAPGHITRPRLSSLRSGRSVSALLGRGITTRRSDRRRRFWPLGCDLLGHEQGPDSACGCTSASPIGRARTAYTSVRSRSRLAALRRHQLLNCAAEPAVWGTRSAQRTEL